MTALDDVFVRIEIAAAEHQLRSALRWRHETPWPRCSPAQASAKERARCRILIDALRRIRALHAGGG